MPSRRGIGYHSAVKISYLIAFGVYAVSGAALAQSSAPPPPLAPITLEGNVAQGAALAATCFGCHGVPGYRNAYPSFHVPKLGGQNGDYLEIALQGYRRGTRGHATMRAQAATLSDQDIADLAAYFVTLEGEAEIGKSDGDTFQIEEGRRKAVACLQCHGEAGVTETMQWPNLAGQHGSYLKQALHEYKTGERADLLMGPLVAPLDDETIAQLAAFFSAQPWLHSTEE